MGVKWSCGFNLNFPDTNAGYLHLLVSEIAGHFFGQFFFLLLIFIFLADLSLSVFFRVILPRQEVLKLSSSNYVNFLAICKACAPAFGLAGLFPALPSGRGSKLSAPRRGSCQVSGPYLEGGRISCVSSR